MLRLPRLLCSISTWTFVADHDAGLGEAAHRIAALGVLDLDHVRAPFGENGGRRRHEGVLGDFEDADALHHVEHGGLLQLRLRGRPSASCAMMLRMISEVPA